MNLQVALLKYKRGQLNCSHLPVIAIQALNDGYKSQALMLLASENDSTMVKCSYLFEAAMKELGIEAPVTTNTKDKLHENLSVLSKQFLEPVRQAFEHNNELLVFRRFAYTAGWDNRWYLIKTWEQWEDLLKEKNPVLKSVEKTAYSVALDRELPIRGRISPELIHEGLQLFDHNGDLIVAKTFQTSQELTFTSFEWRGGRTGQFAEMDLQIRKDEIRQYFEANLGEQVAMGRDFMIWQDEIKWITAYMPDKDGIVKPGAY